MSNSSPPPCSKHPSQALVGVGVCASCLREKLAAFVGSEEREGSPPSVSKSIAIGSYSIMHDPAAPDQQMGSSAPAANELHAAAMETCTSPQITRSSSFDEKLARLSPISSINKQRPLSYYFDLHNNNEGVSTIHKTTQSSNRVEPQYSPLYAPCNAAAAHGRNDPEREHGSFSAVRGHRSPLLDVGESGAPFSWLSALFSKRREKQKARSKQTLASWRGCSSGGGGRGFNEGAYYGNSSSLSWEAPRPSSWEQLSSWEKPWELPSLYNAEPTRASDADLHDYNPTIASQSQINQRIGHGFAVEKKQGRLHWNKVWIKALLRNKWAIKLKSGLIKKRQQAGMDSEGDDDQQASTMSEAASVARGSNQYRHHSQNHYSVQNHASMQQYAMRNRQDGARHSQREIGSNRRGWDSYYSTSVDGLKARQRYKSNSALLRGESGDMSKHNGLLKLYLTPVRGISSRGKSKQWGSRADFFNP